MFNPRAAIATGPRSANIFTGYTANDNIEDFLEGLRATDNNTKAAMLAIIGKLSQVAVSGANTPLAQNSIPMFGSGVAGCIMERLGADEQTPPTEGDKIVALANTQLVTAEVWIWDLVTASKKKELTGDNVEGYFNSIGKSDVKGAPIASMINKVANFLPDMIRDDQFRQGLTDNLWTKYHFSRVSTGRLLAKIAEDFVRLNIINRGDEVWGAIHASAESPHDVQLSYRIPGKIVAYGALFYETAGMDVGKWWQGEKNIARLPAAKVRAIKTIFSKYLELRDQEKNQPTTGNSKGGETHDDQRH